MGFVSIPAHTFPSNNVSFNCISQSLQLPSFQLNRPGKCVTENYCSQNHSTGLQAELQRGLARTAGGRWMGGGGRGEDKLCSVTRWYQMLTWTCDTLRFYSESASMECFSASKFCDQTHSEYIHVVCSRHINTAVFIF